MTFVPMAGDILLIEKKGPAGRIISWWQRKTGPVSGGSNLTHCCSFTAQDKVFEALPLGLKERTFPTKYKKYRHVLIRRKGTTIDRAKITEFVGRHRGRWYSHLMILGLGLMQWLSLDKNPFNSGNICTKECYMWSVNVLDDYVITGKYDRNSLTVEELYEYYINSNDYQIVYDSQDTK